MAVTRTKSNCADNEHDKPIIDSDYENVPMVVVVVAPVSDGDEDDSDVGEVMHTVVSLTGNNNECNNVCNGEGNEIQGLQRQIQ